MYVVLYYNVINEGTSIEKNDDMEFILEKEPRNVCTYKQAK